MKFPLYMTQEQAEQLRYEVVSDELIIYLTRFIESQLKSNDHDSDIELIRMNKIINKSRTITGRPIYVLDAGDDGIYLPQEHAWHYGEIALIFRRLSTPELADFLAELVKDDYFDPDELNDRLKQDGVSFRIKKRMDEVRIHVLSLKDIESSAEKTPTHPNIRILIARMDSALEKEDYSGVLHASASTFETLAKIVVARPSVQNQTLKSFFDRYRQDSALPPEILDYILKIYDDRNVTPLAGHGSTVAPSISKEQAVVLSAMTKAFVQIEYKLSLEETVTAR